MRIKKNFIALILAMLMALSCCMPAYAQERQTTWNLTDIFEDDAALESSIAEVQSEIAGAEDFRGTLNNVDSIVAWYDYGDALLARFSKLKAYAMMKVSLNAGDGAAQAISGRVNNLLYAASEATSFADAEIFSLGDEMLNSIEQDERMQPYLRSFQNTRKQREHILSEEQENMLVPLKMLTSNAVDLYHDLCDLEMPFQNITLPNGELFKADESNYGAVFLNYLYHDFRMNYHEAVMSAYAAMRNTLAQNFQNYCSGVSADAKAHGYSSALEAALIGDEIEPELYKTLIDKSLTGAGIIGQYAGFIKEEMKLDTVYTFDMGTPVAQDPGIIYTYDDACELVLNALAPLGEEYVENARKALSGGWIDAYYSAGKQIGAYSISVPGVHPYMLLNFDGTYPGISTLAHELGHTMNQLYSAQAQSTFEQSTPGIIVTEVTSTLNELLLSDYMIKNAKTDAERKYYISQQMVTLYNTFFVQAQLARFQQLSMEALENGEVLTADLLDNLWLENEQAYSNGLVQDTEHGASGWSRIPHFYQGYYVYQYSMAISASCDIVQRITEGEEGAVEAYLKYIAAGNTGTTADTLLIAGVDISNGDFVDGLMERFTGLIEEYNAIEA